MSLKVVSMRRRVRQEMPPTNPEEEKTPKPEERRGVVHRYRVPKSQYLGGSTSTAAEQLKEIVGKPPAKVAKPADTEISGKLEDAYENYDYNPEHGTEKSYKSALQLLSSLDISETAINTFIRQLLPAHKNERGFKYKAGLFLSAVIQASKDQKITVDVTGLPALNKLCCFLEKKELTIKGDVGDSTAAYAKSGSIIIKGNAGDGTGGDLNGASVIVEGNAKYYTASGAKSGSVTVKGNTGYGTGASLNGASVIVKGAAGNETASGARSGVIHVGGKSGLGENIGENVKIFEAGQQIWPKTK